MNISAVSGSDTQVNHYINSHSDEFKICEILNEIRELYDLAGADKIKVENDAVNFNGKLMRLNVGKVWDKLVILLTSMSYSSKIPLNFAMTVKIEGRTYHLDPIAFILRYAPHEQSSEIVSLLNSKMEKPICIKDKIVDKVTGEDIPYLFDSTYLHGCLIKGFFSLIEEQIDTLTEEDICAFPSYGERAGQNVLYTSLEMILYCNRMQEKLSNIPDLNSQTKLLESQVKKYNSILPKFISLLTSERAVVQVAQEGFHKGTDALLQALHLGTIEFSNSLSLLLKDGSFLSRCFEKTPHLSTLLLACGRSSRTTLTLLDLPNIQKELYLTTVSRTRIVSTNTEFFFNKTPLRLALESYVATGFYSEWKDVIEKMIKNMQELDLLCTFIENMNKDNNPLTLACQHHLFGIANKIIEGAKPVNVVCPPSSFQNALLFAAIYSKVYPHDLPCNQFLKNLIRICPPSAFECTASFNTTFAGRNALMLLMDFENSSTNKQILERCTTRSILEVSSHGIMSGHNVLSRIIAAGDFEEATCLLETKLKEEDKSLVINSVSDPSSWLTYLHSIGYPLLVPLLAATEQKRYIKLSKELQEFILSHVLNSDPLKDSIHTKILREKLLKCTFKEISSPLLVLLKVEAKEPIAKIEDRVLEIVSSPDFSELPEEFQTRFNEIHKSFKPSITLTTNTSSTNENKKVAREVSAPKVNLKKQAAEEAIRKRQEEKLKNENERKEAALKKAAAKPSPKLSSPAASSQIKKVDKTVTNKIKETPLVKTKADLKVESIPPATTPAGTLFAASLSASSSSFVPRSLSQAAAAPIFVPRAAAAASKVQVAHFNPDYVRPSFAQVAFPVTLQTSVNNLEGALDYLIEFMSYNQSSEENSMKPALMYYSLFRFCEIMGNHAHAAPYFVDLRNSLAHQYIQVTPEYFQKVFQNFKVQNLEQKIKDLKFTNTVTINLIPLLEDKVVSKEALQSFIEAQMRVMGSWKKDEASCRPNAFLSPIYAEHFRAVKGIMLSVGEAISVLMKEHHVELSDEMRSVISWRNKLAHMIDLPLAHEPVADEELIKSHHAENFFRYGEQAVSRFIFLLK